MKFFCGIKWTLPEADRIPTSIVHVPVAYSFLFTFPSERDFNIDCSDALMTPSHHVRENTRTANPLAALKATVALE